MAIRVDEKIANLDTDTNTSIHPTSIIEDGAKIEEGVFIGPFCIVGKNVILKKGVKLQSNVVVKGKTTLHEDVEVYPYATIGLPSNDLKYLPVEATTTSIGKGTIVREYASIHAGTPKPTEETGSGTVIGERCVVMQYCHIGHDCKIANNVLMSPYVGISGEVYIGDNVILGAKSGVHQFCTIGKGSMIAGMAKITKDVVPYTICENDDLKGLNIVGLARKGVEKDEIKILRSFYKDLFFSNKDGWDARLVKATKEYSKYAKPSEILDFIKKESRRSICIHNRK